LFSNLLERSQEGDEICPFLCGKIGVKPHIVEIDDCRECLRGAAMEERPAINQTMQNRAFELADVRPSTGDHGATGIGCLHDFSGIFVTKIEDWQACVVQIGVCVVV
jgi:hypothetical protein